MHGRSRSRSVLTFCLIVLLAGGLGCKQDKVVDDETAAEYPLPANGDPVNLKDLDDALKGHKRGKTNPHNRDGTNCNGKCVEVDIESIGLTTDIGEDKPPAKDRVVAELRNKNAQYIETMYNLQPNSKAAYYMWVSGAASGPARWTLVEIVKGSGDTAPATHVKKGVLKQCHTDTLTLPSEADFRSCTGMPDSTAAIKRSGFFSFAVVKSAWALLRGSQDTSVAAPDGPAWLRCVNGCCTTAADQT